VNRYVPLALVLLAPVLVNILLFHILMQPKGVADGRAGDGSLVSGGVSRPLSICRPLSATHSRLKMASDTPVPNFTM